MAPRVILSIAVSAIPCILASFWLLLPVPAFGAVFQQVSPQGTSSLSDQWLKPGIVVEKVQKGQPGAATGLKVGDVLLRSSDGVARTVFASPMDFMRIQNDQSMSLRRVVIHGLRGNQKRVWQLPLAGLQVTTRPNLSPRLLLPYLKTKELEEKGQATEAAAQWLALARNTGIPIRWLRAWLISRAAAALFDAKDWEQANQVYKTAVEDLDPFDISGAFWIWKRALALHHDGAFKAADDLYEEAGARIAAAGAGATSLAVSNLFARYSMALSGSKFDVAAAYATKAQEIQQRFRPDGRLFLWAIGWVALARGDFAKAEDCYRRQLISRGSSTEYDRMLSWWGLGIVAQARGDLNKASKYIAMAESIARKPTYGDHLAILYGIHGMIVRDGGDFHAADQYFRKALEIGQNTSRDSAAVASNYDHLAVLYQLEGDLGKAEAYLTKALEVCSTNCRDLNTLACAHTDLADVLQQRGDFDGAADHYRQALETFRKIVAGTKYQAEVFGGLAKLMRRTGRWDDAATFYEQAVAMLEGQTIKLGGSDDARTGFRAKYENYYREYIDLLLAQNKPEPAFDVLERSRARTLLETLSAAHVDIRQGADRELVAKEWRLQADVKAKSERRISLLSGKHSDDQVKAIEKEISDLTAEYQDIEGQIRSTSPSYAALTQPQPLSAKQIQQQLLDPDTVLLEYSLGEERSHVFAVTPDSLQAFELPKRAEIEQLARRAYQLLTAPNRNSAAATPARRRARLQAEQRLPQALDELSRMILGPVAAQLREKRLLIVPDGALHYIPFQALPEPQAVAGSDAPAATPLVAQHEIINLPSASVLAVLRQQQMSRPAAPKAVAVLADPVFTRNDPRLLHNGAMNDNGTFSRSPQIARSHDDLLDSSFSTGILTRSAAEVGLTRGERLELPRLRFSRQEADSILAVTPQGSGLKALDFRASRATATSPELGQYRIVHFATHGLLNSEHPELSGLVLSLVDRKGRRQEGFLELQDIYNLKLHADLVVLSACETGLGKEISGEGLIGMTRGFMYAGASRVVASLWKVSDAATAQLMAEFYRSMEKDGMAPAAALRQAQIAMWKQKRWSSPYFWAAFQLQGEWK